MDNSTGTLLGSAAELAVPAEVIAQAAETTGARMESVCRVDRYVQARDFMFNAGAVDRRLAVLQRHAPVRPETRVLEVGSGFGMTLAALVGVLGADAVGVEPAESELVAARSLLAANGIDPGRVVAGRGEELPFPDESFDVVYSANVLEHVPDPAALVAEGIRVLRPGGTLHFEVPNYLSYFEGHYLVPQPPLVSRRILPWWVRLFGRDPWLARELSIQINPRWCRRTIRRLARTQPITLESLGEEEFLEWAAGSDASETGSVAATLTGRAVSAARRANAGNWMGRLVVALDGQMPIYLTARKAT